MYPRTCYLVKGLENVFLLIFSKIIWLKWRYSILKTKFLFILRKRTRFRLILYYKNLGLDFKIIPLSLMSALFTSTLLLFHSHIVLYCFWCCICIIWLIPLMVCIQSSAKPWQFAHLLTGRTKTNGF